VAQGLGGEVGERRVVVLLGPVPGDLGRLQPPFGGRPVLAQLAQTVAEPPLLGLDGQSSSFRAASTTALGE